MPKNKLTVNNQQSTVKKSKAETSKTKARKVKAPQYKSFRVSKRIKQPKEPLTGSFKLFASAVKVLWRHRVLFGGITLIYLILTVLLVKGLGVSGNISGLRTTILDLFHGRAGELYGGLALFGILLSTASSTNSDVAGAYQSMLLIIVSLALIWALRQSLAGKTVKLQIRDAFYKGLYPLVPFVLVLLIIGLQLLPLVAASFLYSTVIVGGLAVTAIEKGLWILLLLLFAVLSLYMVSSSIFALYIVTLPDVRPLQALRSARDVVRYRRAAIMRKVLFLPVALVLLGALIIVPLIIVSAVAAEWVFFVLSMLGLAIVHSYLYGLYRELL